MTFGLVCLFGFFICLGIGIICMLIDALVRLFSKEPNIILLSNLVEIENILVFPMAAFLILTLLAIL